MEGADKLRHFDLQNGGTMSLFASSATLTACTISNSTAGKVRLQRGKQIVQKLAALFKGLSLQNGGTMSLTNSSTELTSCTISSSSAVRVGQHVLQGWA